MQVTVNKKRQKKQDKYERFRKRLVSAWKKLNEIGQFVCADCRLRDRSDKSCQESK